MTHADIIRTLVIDGDLSTEIALPSDCTRSEAEAVLGPGERGSGLLSNRQRTWSKHPFGERSVARVWTEIDGDQILMIDVDYPPVRERPDGLLARLGDAAAIIRARVNPVHKEHAFPARGITIAIGGERETPPNPRVTYLFVYPPTTLDDYNERLGGNEAWVIRNPLR